MQIDILTIFPEMFASPFGSTIIKRGCDAGAVKINLINIRDFATDPHKTVDDAPYGGGAGMVMKADILARVVESIERVGKNAVVLLSAQGEKLEHKVCEGLSKFDQLVLVCGRYEGVDQRFIELYVDREISVGDYVLSGGEIPAMIVCDSVIRLLPNVLGNEESLISESFSDGLLEYPHYTRPPEFRGLKVPEVLLSGHHKEIEKWRTEQSRKITKERRPDLLKK